jgi:hypothetical protein
MWDNKPNLIEGKKYKVMDGNKFCQICIFEGNKFINHVFKNEVKVRWVWNQ